LIHEDVRDNQIEPALKALKADAQGWPVPGDEAAGTHEKPSVKRKQKQARARKKLQGDEADSLRNDE
jgi:ribosomal protein S21